MENGGVPSGMPPFSRLPRRGRLPLRLSGIPRVNAEEAEGAVGAEHCLTNNGVG